MIFLAMLIIQPTLARIGYDIVASTEGSSFEIHRYTENVNFTVEGFVNGTGNFSRLSYIRDFAGIKGKEKSSSTKKGRLSYDERTILKTREGPVVVTINLESINLSDNEENDNKGPILIDEYGKISVDEKWPAYFSNYKTIYYYGPMMRISESYENNGDIVASKMESWQLSKSSFYQASYNRTIIDVNLTPIKAFQEKFSNKTSLYVLNQHSIGNSELDIIRSRSTNDIFGRIHEEYKGKADLNLKIGMRESIFRSEEEVNGIDCCSVPKYSEII